MTPSRPLSRSCRHLQTKLGEALYAQAQADAAAGEGAKAEDDDVVDAEVIDEEDEKKNVIMAENTNEPVDDQPEGTDPLEEAFAAPAAEGHPEPEGVAAEAAADEESAAAEAGESAEAAESADAALAAERLEDLRRLQAEFTNYKNRTAKEKDQLARLRHRRPGSSSAAGHGRYRCRPQARRP